MIPRGLNLLNLLTLAVLMISIIITAYNIRYLHIMQYQHFQNAHAETANCKLAQNSRPSYSVFAKHEDSGYLKHVYAIFKRAGFTRVTYNTSDDWSVMWAHDYPFEKIKPIMMNMKSHQKVNKLPGSGFVTNKVNLATSKSPFIPKAFRIPNDVDKLRKYAEENPEIMFVQKNHNHRGIKIEKLGKLDLKSTGSFVQVYVQDPFLIDGYKFDIGVYTIVTSIDPLRIYVYDGDVAFRFCPEKYYPFDSKITGKYVILDDYRPMWKVPALSKYFSDLGYTFKETFNAHIKSLGNNPEAVWSQVHEIIRNTYSSKEREFTKAASHYPYPQNFFEITRFDFILDSKLKVYLMEANMSPNLSSGHFGQNRILYEQVIYNMLRLVGVARGGLFGPNLLIRSHEEQDMLVSDKDMAVFAEECASPQCSKPNSCDNIACHLCNHCVTSDERIFLRAAYLEHLNRHTCKRIYPKPISRNEIPNSFTDKKIKNQLSDRLSINNAKMYQWFFGKCAQSSTWCE